MKRRAALSDIATDLMLIGPALLFYLIIMVVTVILGFYYSLTDWDGIRTSIHIIGFDNYLELIRDKYFYNALYKTLIFAVFFTIVQNIFGLALALFFQQNSRVNNIFKTALFIPFCLAPLSISYIWNYIYSPFHGFLNEVTKALFGWPEIAWLGDPDLAMGSVIATQVWQTVGFAMVIYIAGLKGIPDSQYEAASIDGANSWQKFFYITIPLLAPVTTILVVYDLIASFKTFDLIFVMTNGGPGYATETITMKIYREAFANSRMGYSTAISVVLFVLLLVITILQMRFLKKREVEY